MGRHLRQPEVALYPIVLHGEGVQGRHAWSLAEPRYKLLQRLYPFEMVFENGYLVGLLAAHVTLGIQPSNRPTVYVSRFPLGDKKFAGHPDLLAISSLRRKLSEQHRRES
jgi:hypothetical protein